jgi:hypothetical protein
MMAMKPKRKRYVKCGFSYGRPAAGDCRECGEPAEPGAKKLCIDCAIEKGFQPLSPKRDGTQKDKAEK